MTVKQEDEDIVIPPDDPITTTPERPTEDEEIVIPADEKSDEELGTTTSSQEDKKDDQNGTIEDGNSTNDNNDENNNSIHSSSERNFPIQFFDPLNPTVLLKDPVVDASGNTHERSSITAASSADVVYYENRALKSIMEREIELTNGDMRAKLRRIDESVRSTWKGLLEKSVFNIENRPLPDAFYCIITTELMTDPVVTKEGFSYEREAIENWIAANHKSPLTRTPLELSDLRDNNALYELIQLEKNKATHSGGAVHPSIRRWKESGAASERPEIRPDYSNVSSTAAADTAAAPATPGGSTYPITEEELNARNARGRKCTAIAFIITLVVFIYAPGYLMLVGILWWLVILCNTRSERR